MSEYISIYKEITKIGRLFHKSEVEEAKNCYEQYVQLIITDGKLSKLEKNSLFDYWDDMVK